MHTQDLRKIALQASGEYLMNNIANVMEMVQDHQALQSKYEFDEDTLVAIEAQVKILAEELTRQSQDATS